jgi:hypothetical protein
LLVTMIARAWEDRLAALVALVLFHVAPIAQAVIGTANLTNAFGESMALATVAALVLLPLTAPRWVWVSLPALLAAVAFVAHFSTLVVLAANVGAISMAWRWFGEPPVRQVSSRVVGGLALAVVFSFAAFYGHFWDTYRSQAQRLTGEARAIVADDDRLAQPDAAAPIRPPKPPKARASAAQRVAATLRRTRGAFGLMYAGLALAGAMLCARQKRRDRLSLAIWAWLSMLAVFSALAVLTPLEMRYHLAVAPAVAALAAVAAAGWMKQGLFKVIACAWVTLLIVQGARGWYGWLF